MNIKNKFQEFKHINCDVFVLQSWYNNWSNFDFGTTMASFWMKAKNKWGGQSRYNDDIVY